MRTEPAAVIQPFDLITSQLDAMIFVPANSCLPTFPSATNLLTQHILLGISYSLHKYVKHAPVASRSNRIQFHATFSLDIIVGTNCKN